MQPPSTIRQFAAFWLIGALMTIGGLAILTAATLDNHGWWGYLRLVNGGSRTRAVIVRTAREDHCRAEYSFVVEGSSYSGSGADCDARIGKEVLITYRRSDPRQSCIGVARNGLLNELLAFFSAGVIVPPFVLLAFRQRRNGRARSGA